MIRIYESRRPYRHADQPSLHVCPSPLRLDEYRSATTATNPITSVGVQDRPWMCYLISIVITSVLIYELARSASVTGSAFAPFSQNYMGGPRSEMLINLGSRFTACMRDIPAISSMPFQCLNSTTSSRETCTLEEICGLGGFEASGKPGQTFRFFTALWLHVGIIHLLLNMLVLLTSSGLVEKQMGSLKYATFPLSPPGRAS